MCTPRIYKLELRVLKLEIFSYMLFLSAHRSSRCSISHACVIAYLKKTPFATMAFVLYFLFLTNKEFIVLLLSVFYWCSDLSKHAACNHTHTIYHGIWGVFDRVQSWNEQHYVDGWHTHILVLLLLLLLLLPLVLRCAAVVLLMLLCCCAAAAAAARVLLFFIPHLLLALRLHTSLAGASHETNAATTCCQQRSYVRSHKNTSDSQIFTLLQKPIMKSSIRFSDSYHPTRFASALLLPTSHWSLPIPSFPRSYQQTCVYARVS